MDHDIAQVFVVGAAFLVAHIVIEQLFACFTQAGGGRIRTNGAVFQIFDPFFKRRNGYLVELVHTDQVVFRKNLCRKFMHQGIFLLDTHFQTVARMYARKDILTVVQVIASLTDIEIKDTHGVDLFHFVVAATQRNMLRDGLGHPIKDTFEESKLTRVLYFHYDDFTLAVFSLDVYPVEFVVNGLLIALALQQFDDLHLFVQQHRQETFQHTEIGFLS